MNLTVVGINRVSLAIAQILKERAVGFTITGFDPDAKRTRQAAGLKVFKQTTGSLRPAVANAEGIILSLPFDRIEEVISHLSRLIPPQTILVDTSMVKQPVLAWAQQYLPQNPFVSVYPCIHPRRFDSSLTAEWDIQSDLFTKSACFIVTSAQSTRSAMHLVEQLIDLLGASPVLIDAGEFDSCLANAELFPSLLAAACLRTIMQQPGYRDSQKLASEAFYQMVESVTQLKGTGSIGQSLAASRQNLTRLLDDLDEELIYLKGLLNLAHQEELQKYLTETVQAGTDWLKKRESGDFESLPAARGARKTSLLQGLFASSLFNSRKRLP